MSPHILLVFQFLLLAYAESVQFNFIRFDNSTIDICYGGDAKPNNMGAIEQNRVDFVSRIGHATYAKSMQLWDSKSGNMSDFTNVTFSIETPPSYGDGLAFFLAPTDFQIPSSSSGGFLGLFNTNTRNQKQIIFIESDSGLNPEFSPPDQHVGISDNSLDSVVWAPWNASLHNGSIANVWITYNATTTNLILHWTYELNPSIQGNNSHLSYVMDLRQVTPEWVKVGFSAATGNNVERHIIRSWAFNSTYDTSGSGTGRRNEAQIRLIVGLVIFAAALILGTSVVASTILWRRKGHRAQCGRDILDGITGDFETGAGPKRFTYKELVSATNNFSNDRKLGEGGFGCVYKGQLTELDLAVAVKKMSRSSKQGKKEYVTEIKTIGQLRHRNLVQLIGWCHERGEFLLVYEYMSNGSLDLHLFGKRSPLTWDIRYKIVLGLASGLLYLHEGWEQCVVHRDIKSGNIMLDSSFNAKLGDFGLARLMDHEVGPKTTGLAGTLGYLAPEYIRTGKASKESDVFSFGVVALEVACGRKSVDPMMREEFQMGLVEWVWDLHGKGKLLTAVDKRLSRDFDVEQLECLMIVGLWCAHPDHNLRPSIRQVIQVLMFETTVPDLPPNMPVPSYHVHARSKIFSEASMITTSLDAGR